MGGHVIVEGVEVRFVAKGAGGTASARRVRSSASERIERNHGRSSPSMEREAEKGRIGKDAVHETTGETDEETSRRSVEKEQIHGEYSLGDEQTTSNANVPEEEDNTAEGNGRRRRSEEIGRDLGNSGKRKASSMAGTKNKLNAHSATEKRRRDRITERMETLKQLVPHQSKADKAAFLADVINYIQQLHSLLRQSMALNHQMGMNISGGGNGSTNQMAQYNPINQVQQVANQIQNLAPTALANVLAGQRQQSLSPGNNPDFSENLPAAFENFRDQQQLQQMAFVQQVQASHEQQFRHATQHANSTSPQNLSMIPLPHPFEHMSFSMMGQQEGTTTAIGPLEGTPVSKAQQQSSGNLLSTFLPYTDAPPWAFPLQGYPGTMDGAADANHPSSMQNLPENILRSEQGRKP